MTAKINISGIILSAGLSGRMNNFKPLMQTQDGSTFIQSITRKLFSVSNEVVIVTGYKHKEVLKNITDNCTFEKCKVISNGNYVEGMFSSLKVGLENTKGNWFLYHFVDQPSLPISFYKDFVKQIDSSINWIQPKFNEQKGHPILFDNFVKTLVLESDIHNLREVSRNPLIKKKIFSINSPLILEDIDTQDDYQSMLTNQP